MFFSEDLLSKDGALAPVWLAANMEKKLSRQQFMKTDITSSVHAIVDSAGVPLALRLSGQLLLGVVRIYSKKTVYLMDECNEVLLKLKMAFRPGNVDMDQATVAVAKTQTLTLQNKVTDLDLLLLPDPDFDFDQDFMGSSQRRGRRNADDDGASLLISSQVASALHRRDITLPDMDDTVDVGRGRAKNDLDDLDENQDLDLGLNFEDELEDQPQPPLDDLDLDIDAPPLPEREEEDYDMGGDLGGYQDDIPSIEISAEELEKRKAAFKKQLEGAVIDDEDVEHGLSAPPLRPEGEDIEHGADDSAFRNIDVDMPEIDADATIAGPTDPSADFDLPVSPGGPATPTNDADILGHVEVAGDLGVDENARRSVFDDNGKADDNVSIMTSQYQQQQLQHELYQQQQADQRRQRRNALGPRHAHVDRQTEIETSNSQMQLNRESIVRTDRSMLPEDPTIFSLMTLSTDNSRFLSAIFRSSRQHPDISRLLAPEFVNQMMKRKRSLSDIGREADQHRRVTPGDETIEGDSTAPTVPEVDLSLGSDLDAQLNLDFGEEQAPLVPQEDEEDRDMGPTDFGDTDQPELELSAEELAKRKEAFKAQLAGAVIEDEDEYQAPLSEGPAAATTEEEDLGEAPPLIDDDGFGSPLPEEEEDELAGGAASVSGVSQYTIKAAKMVRQHIREDEAIDAVGAENAAQVDFNTMLGPVGKSTRVKMFFELLVLATKDAIKVKQDEPFGDIGVSAKTHLYSDMWDEVQPEDDEGRQGDVVVEDADQQPIEV